MLDRDSQLEIAKSKSRDFVRDLLLDDVKTLVGELRCENADEDLGDL